MVIPVASTLPIGYYYPSIISGMMLKLIHSWTGIIFFTLFLDSGMYMKLNFPEIYGTQSLIRMMYRANHIYLLMASLINLITGIYYHAFSSKLDNLVQKSGWVFLVISPFTLFLAFIVEPARMTFERTFTFIGVLFLLLGILGHFIGNLLGKKA